MMSCEKVHFNAEIVNLAIFADLVHFCESNDFAKKNGAALLIMAKRSHVMVNCTSMTS